MQAMKAEKEEKCVIPSGKTASGHATTPAGGESGGRPHGRLGGGEESDRVSTVANDP